MTFRLAMMAAKAANNVIGRNNALPWYLPNDLKYFKKVTFGKPIIMGRKTWESIGRPLPGRSNIVVSSQSDFRADGAELVASLEAALDAAKSIARRDGVDEVFVIGGETLYRQSMAMVERIYLTEVAVRVAGDAFYPPIDGEWEEVSRECYPEEADQPAYAFVLLSRR